MNSTQILPVRALNKQPVVCFGEILWDCLPAGLFLGGAPLNVAYHLAQNAVHAIHVGAVGVDFLGAEALRRMDTWGVDTRFVMTHPELATGSVAVDFTEEGPAYRIRRPAAWDQIIAGPSLLRLVRPAAVVFGTLALRTQANRRALDMMLKAWPDALVVVDLNLRAPHDTVSALRFALSRASLLKVNDGELARLVGRDSLRSCDLEWAARSVLERHALQGLCVTAGSRGAGMLLGECWTWAAARKIKVEDTVGAGDAFLSTFLAAWLMRKESVARSLALACRAAEFVATQRGATPSYTPRLRSALGLPSGSAAV